MKQIFKNPSVPKSHKVHQIKLVFAKLNVYICYRRKPKPRPWWIICRRLRGVPYLSVPVDGMQHPRYLHLQILSFYSLKISENASARRGLGSAVNATSCFQVWSRLPRAEQVSFNLSNGWQRVKRRCRHVTWSSDAKTLHRYWNPYSSKIYNNNITIKYFHKPKITF